MLSVSGEVTVEDAEGARLEAKSVSGDVNLSRVGSLSPVDVVVESVSGDVRLEDVSGSIALQTISGDADIVRSTTGLFTAKTVSGDLGVALNSPFIGVVSLGTMSGDVNLSVPQDSGFRYTLDTQSGEISFELPGEIGSRSATLYTGTVGSGEGSVSVQTRSGDVKVLSG